MKTPKQHQKEARKWLTKRRFGILGDDMGLGKTYSAIITLRRLLKQKLTKQVLIIVPANLLDNWVEEFEDATRIKPYVYHGARRSINKARESKVILTSYGIILNDAPKFNVGFKKRMTVILDEGHKIKGRDKATTMAVKSIKSDLRYILTGTPIQDNPSDLWSLLHFLNPEVSGTAQEWDTRYVKFIMTVIRTRYKGEIMIPKAAGVKPGAIGELNRLLARHMLRRTKDECVDIPPKTVYYEAYPLDHKTKDLYSLVCSEYMGYASISRVLTRLAQCLSGLVKSGIDDEEEGTTVTASFYKSAKQKYLEEKLEGLSGRVIVWFRYAETMWHIAKTIKQDVYAFDGQTRNQTQIIRAWKESKNGVLFATIRAGGTGLNLTEANYSIFYEMDFVPAHNEQAEDRIYRIGQKNKTTIYYLYAKDTVEEAIVNLVRAKSKLNKAIVQGGAKKKTLEYLYNKTFSLFGHDNPEVRQAQFKRYLRLED